MKKILYLSILFVVFSSVNVNSQQQLAYSFGETPQTLMLNPGAETNFKYHYGIPVFSNFNLNVGLTGFDLSELFLADNQSFRDKFRRVLDKIDQDDYINLNARIDILNGGYRYDDRTYLSFGFYEEVDVIAYFPKDIADLVYYGNVNFLNRSFSFSQLSVKADVLGVLHAGISRKVDEKLNIGARVKIYSSSLNIETNHNSGTFTTFANPQNILRQSLNDVNVNIYTSGLVGANDKVLDNGTSILSKTFLGGNLGIGFDFGLTYHFTPQLEFTGSILDLGFVRHSKNTRVYSAKGDYTFDGINFQHDPDNPRDYWQELEDDFDDKVPTDETAEAYTSWRPTKLNAALKYSFGEIRRRRCYANTRKQYYYNAIGFQVHSVFRPSGPKFSYTSFFETSLSEKIHTKVTHTINDYSATIIGSGFTFQWGKVNVFGLVDNMLGASDLLSASNISINFGINMVID
ncbi:DUF5723 family protein [Pseudotenacibaculum sp. MALMAid0570]|uniref:DUF5723 family protein n=1 Tax=Pseudotenacibaculum sp. MALMAid0570 TaxID=3143938 RepID=UPI0032DF8D5A